MECGKMWNVFQIELKSFHDPWLYTLRNIGKLGKLFTLKLLKYVKMFELFIFNVNSIFKMKLSINMFVANWQIDFSYFTSFSIMMEIIITNVRNMNFYFGVFRFIMKIKYSNSCGMLMSKSFNISSYFPNWIISINLMKMFVITSSTLILSNGIKINLFNVIHQ